MVMLLFEFFIKCLLLQATIGQLSIELTLNQQSFTLYSNQQANSAFVLNENMLKCSSSLTEYGQNSQQYDQGTTGIISITGNTQNLALSITSKYNHFSPTLSSSTCTLPSCSISLFPNCPSQLSDSNYFDLISITITPLGTYSFYFNCNLSFNTTYFQYGGLILISLATLILIISTSLGRWNAFGGYGIKYEYRMIGIISISVLTVGLLGIYRPDIAEIVMDIGNTAAIIASVSILAIEGLYFLKITPIQKKIIQKGSISIRILDVLGVLLSIPVVVAWWLIEDSWIFSDIIAVLLVISIIKVFKFVSLKVAVTAYLIMVTIYTAAAIFVAIKFKDNPNRYYLSQANTPFQLQFPLFTPAYGERCTWVSITTIAFPGLLVSYLRRFDQSRSTRIYLITAIGTYFLGSVLWWVASTFSFYQLPFDAFCEPIMIVAFTLFAFKRKELRTLWEGKFYDEEFKNKDEIEAIGRHIAEETPNEDYFKGQLVEHMFLEMREDSELEHSKQINNDEL